MRGGGPAQSGVPAIARGKVGARACGDAGRISAFGCRMRDAELSMGFTSCMECRGPCPKKRNRRTKRDMGIVEERIAALLRRTPCDIRGDGLQRCSRFGMLSCLPGAVHGD